MIVRPLAKEKREINVDQDVIWAADRQVKGAEGKVKRDNSFGWKVGFRRGTLLRREILFW